MNKNVILDPRIKYHIKIVIIVAFLIWLDNGDFHQVLNDLGYAIAMNAAISFFLFVFFNKFWKQTVREYSEIYKEAVEKYDDVDEDGETQTQKQWKKYLEKLNKKDNNKENKEEKHQDNDNNK